MAGIPTREAKILPASPGSPGDAVVSPLRHSQVPSRRAGEAARAAAGLSHAVPSAGPSIARRGPVRAGSSAGGFDDGPRGDGGEPAAAGARDGAAPGRAAPGGRVRLPFSPPRPGAPGPGRKDGSGRDQARVIFQSTRPTTCTSSAARS